MAAYLDPVSHKYLDENEKRDAKFYISQVKSSVRFDTSASETSGASGNEEMPSSSFDRMIANIQKDDEDDQLKAPSSSKQKQAKKKRTKAKSIKEELTCYEGFLLQYQGLEFKEFWSMTSMAKELPKLSVIARRTNTSSPTSAPSESTFSIAGYHQRQHRSSLNSVTLRYEMITRQIKKIDAILESFNS